MQAKIARVHVAEPLRPTLAIMAKTANEAARNWTLQEHVGRIAATAGPRDYIGQLRALYDDFTKRRWRYVMEPGERVPGTARALMGHVFGQAYNRDDRGAWVRGFGDCDDASTFIAGAALAMGMRPSWRVAQWPGGAHVSVVVETPRGERVSVDPVGYPDKPFGWALEPVGGSVALYNIGEERSTMGEIGQTWFAGPQHGIRVGRLRPHVILRASNDDRGARVLAMPLWAQRVFKRGLVVPKARAVDQYGEIYEYVAGWDAWAPVRGAAHNMRGVDSQSLDGRAERRARRRARRTARKAERMQRRGKRQARRKARWKAAGAKIKGFFVKVRKGLARVLRKISQSKIAGFFRKLKSKFLKSKLVQAAISTVLGAFGVPPTATRAVMEREAALADRGGRSMLAALVAEGKWGQAAKMVGGSFIDAGKKVAANVGLSGYERESLAGLAESGGARWVMEQGGRVWHVAPVAAMAGVRGAYFAGQLEVSETPESGRWYRIQPGDTLLGVVGDAFGVGPGAQRLKIAKWVNAAAANACLHTTDISATEKKWFGGSRISFKPKFSCSREEQERCAPGSCFGLLWLAPAPGVEPPDAPSDEPIDEPVDEPIDEPVDLPSIDDPEETPEIDPPPAPPDEPDEPEPVEPEEVEPEPEPEPVGPVIPPEPDEPDVVDDEPDEPPAEDPDEPPDDDPEPAPVPPPPAPVDLPDLEPPPPMPSTGPSIAKGLGVLGLILALSEGRR